MEDFSRWNYWRYVWIRDEIGKSQNNIELIKELRENENDCLTITDGIREWITLIIKLIYKEKQEKRNKIGYLERCRDILWYRKCIIVDSEIKVINFLKRFKIFFRPSVL